MKRKNKETGTGSGGAAKGDAGAAGAAASGKGEGKSELVPAKSEVEVLKILWKDGPSTVRHVHDTLVEETKSVQYTSTLKLMQVMTEKGMLARDETAMKHIYMPLLEEQRTMALVLEKFLHSMYNGSISNLMVAFMANEKTSKKELQKVKALLDKLEKGE
jgi:BlaI family penicillinase repressor